MVNESKTVLEHEGPVSESCKGPKGVGKSGACSCSLYLRPPPLTKNKKQKTKKKGVGATDGGAEAGAEDALIRQDAGGMLLISEHPAVDPNFP